jgi:predicted ABC-type ATPase
VGRVRIFAGPNGSGKTTLNMALQGAFNLGHYLNADDLFKKVQYESCIDFKVYNLAPSVGELEAFIQQHGLYPRLSPGFSFKFVGSKVEFHVLPNIYEIAILTDFLRFALLKTARTFSFETVFSHPDKVKFINIANKKGYRTYLYFVSTISPEINIERIKQRVLEGGHEVPEDKIRERYYRSLKNLRPAIQQSYRTFIFDNSGKGLNLLAAVTPSKNINIEAKRLPVWFEKYVLSVAESSSI